jgi:heme/copper-type cytochrome/quinol oxidase subunit 4
MTALLRHSTTYVWLLLVAATFASWWLGTDHGLDSHTTATLAIMTVAFIKVRFVGLYFMELRDAPLPLRLAFESYVVLVLGVVAGFYLLA